MIIEPISITIHFSTTLIRVNYLILASHPAKYFIFA
jgi:hypothetical protein